MKESQNSRNQGFTNCFCLMIEGSGSESGSVPLTTYPDPEGQKLTDPTDPDRG
jgi:hypothetical protein